jgi:hypothetical protein
METFIFQRLSFGQRVNSPVSSEQSRQWRQATPVQRRASVRPRVFSFLVLTVCKSKVKVVAGPAGPVSCSSLPQGSQPHRFKPSGGLLQSSSCRAVVSPRVGSQRSVRPCLLRSTSGLAVFRHFHRRAAWLHRRPNPSVKGTSPASGPPLTSNVRPLAQAIAQVMHFGTATPVFFVIVGVVLLTGVAAAVGLNAIAAFVLGFFASYILFISTVIGFRDSSSVAIAAGWGVLAMMPAATGLVASAFVGHLIYRHRSRNKGKFK